MTVIEDELTRLANRRSFLLSLQRHVLLVNERKVNLGLLVIDVDSFAMINNAHGFAFGDRLLQHLAQQLRKVARSHDAVGRIGDNRFGLVLTGLMNGGHAELAVHKLQRLLDTPFEHGNAKVKISVSVGIALCPQHASQSDHLLRRAERSLATARATGQKYMFPTDGVDDALSDLWDIEIELDSANALGELAMHYQPKVSMHDLRPVGAEALMRWRSSTRGNVSPDVFIPVAEKTGQIKKLTAWAINTALRHASEWVHPWETLSVAVNVPAEMVVQYDLPDLIENALSLWGRPQVGLVLEITERSLIGDPKQSFRILSQIREMGVKISIDDFGTGYSCLAYFKNIPADELKIDKSFIASLIEDSASAEITSLIIDLAHRFNLTVVAEGVEDELTFDALRSRGCDVAQGFLFSKALSSTDFGQWLKQRGKRGQESGVRVP